MTPPRKVPKTQEEADKFEKQRLRNREYYKKNREKRANARERRRREAKERRAAIRKNPTVSINPTIASIGGYFAGDGCVHSDSRQLSVFSETLAVLSAFKEALGGSVRKCNYKNGFLWTARGNVHAIHAARLLLPVSLNKQEQLNCMIKSYEMGEKGSDRQDQLSEMKTREPLCGDISTEGVAGFFSADGYAGRRIHQPYVVFGQKFRAVLDSIAAKFPGGSEIKAYNPTCNGNKTDKNGEKYRAFQLTYSGEPCRKLLQQIEPYILVERKREIVQLLLTINSSNSEIIRAKIDSLNKK